MAGKTVAAASPAAERLCSEIQLFDLCDLDSCRFKRSRFCTNEELVAKFEAIKEEDEQNALLYEEEEDSDDADSETDFDDFDDSFDEDDEFT
jgi:hypothetical protein